MKQDSKNGLVAGPTIESIKRELSALEGFRPAAVYLFGSTATGNFHPNSDIDIAFLPTIDCEPVAVFEIANLLAQKLGHDVDLVDISSSSTVMRKEIFRTGILLLDPMPMQRMEFEMRTLSDYARLNEDRKSILIHTGSFAA